MKKLIKKLLFGNSPQYFTIRFGIGKGIKMKIDPSHKSQRIIGLDEFEIHTPFKLFARNSSAFVDIGSSDGYYGLIYKKYNPSGSIVSCEAQSHFEAEQRKNYEINKLDLKDNFYFHSSFIGSVNSNKTISIDSLVKKYSLKDIFLKIDIDGGELEALKGAAETLKNNSCMLIVETHSQQLEKDCIALLENIGYQCKIIPNAALRKLIPERRIIEHNRWLTATKGA